ncbi:MAG: transcriptional repressor [Aquificae bacterium]|nr:transcriptional repressor [Aquificota bacterium]
MKRRNTQQRKVILDILRSTNTHPTADWIYEKARQYIPNISLGTVYRNLKILKDEGLIIELNDGKQSRFDGRVDRHFHFKCLSCNRIFDIETTDVVSINEEKLKEEGYHITGYEISFTGLCSHCQQEKN